MFNKFHSSKFEKKKSVTTHIRVLELVKNKIVLETRSNSFQKKKDYKVKALYE